MNYEVLVATIDWSKVNAVVLAAPLLSQADRADLGSMLLKACKKWIAPDTDNLRVTGVEQRFLLRSAPGFSVERVGATDGGEEALGEHGVKGYMDLVGWRRDFRVGDGGGVAIDSQEIIDWKCVGTISDEQQTRLRDSWQWKLYCVATGATRFTYRSIQRDGRVKDTVLRWSSENYGNQEVENQLRMVQAMRSTLRYYDTWPRHAPFACRAYNRECDYVQQCRAGTMPLKVIPLKALSHSRMETFLLCPERYRRDRLVEIETDRQETALGKAFHAAVAEIYMQIYNLTPQENNE